jgi:tetratricopeptide (TPR) repeat protein
LTESFLRRFIDRSHNEGAPLDVGWALVELAGLRESVGDLTQAIELKQRAAEIAEPEDARRLRLESARLASRVSDLELSATIYRDLLAQDPADREAWEPLLEVYERLERWDALAELLFKVVDYVEDARHRSRLRLDRVRVLMKHLGLGDEAAPLLRDIVDDDPSQVEAAMMLAGIFERQGNVDDLAALLGKQLDGAKDRQDSLSVGTLSLRLGRLLEAKDPLEAKSVLYAGLDWVGQDKEILDLLARIHGRLGQGLERADLLERVLPLVRGEEAELRAIEVHELRKAEGDDEGAERALEVGFRVNPVSLVLGERLERSYRGRGAWEKLAEMFVLDARSRTNSIDRVRRLSDAARIHRNELHQPAVAAALLIEARRDAPESSPLFDELMGALVEAGRHAEAHDQVTAALAAHASDMARRLPLLLKRASLRIELEDERGALADLEEATTLAGDGARPIAAELERLSARAAQRGDVSTGRTIGLLLAAVLSKAGDPEGARARLLDLLRRDAKDREALRALAQIDKQAARWDAVIATYRRLVTLEEGDAVVLAASELADACERIGRQEDARGALERARLVAPRAEGLHERLARLYEHIGAYKELAEMSLSYAAEAKDVAGRFAHLVRAGALLVQHVTDSNVAISALEEAHALRPADMECIVLLADAYTLAGRTADAVELVNVAILAHKGKRSRELSALHHRLARAAHSVGDRASELAWLTSALDVDAQNGFVAAELAQIALEDRHLDLATRALRAVTLLKNPTTSPMSKAVAYQKLGEVAREQGDVKRAVLLLKRALDEDPTLATARALLDALAVE